ncbi:ATP-binding protein [Brevibacillus agri]|uniref:ATP-binding protein n=1 Tax=Brevibacillus agri TaxID=51101 RepID=UPI002E213ED3|nr:ATP-binding protein [Brevibacillus agri]
MFFACTLSLYIEKCAIQGSLRRVFCKSKMQITAIWDRHLHHSYIVNIRGNSFRLRLKMRTGAYTPPSTT